MASSMFNSTVGGHARVKVGTGEELRKVERDIMVPKIMKEKSMEICKDYVDAFQNCCKGRTLSLVWVCRKENTAMQDCLVQLYEDKKFQEECRQEYLQERAAFQQTGIPRKFKKYQKHSEVEKSRQI